FIYVLYYFLNLYFILFFYFFFQAEDGIRDSSVTGVQTCALPISNVRVIAVVTACPPPVARPVHGQRHAAVRTFERVAALAAEDRSEERRVGKECRSRWGPEH